MGRPRQFSEPDAVAAASTVLVRRGFAGTSVDDLVRATGVNRASLYGVFGSKDGLFRRCLAAALEVLAGADGERADDAVPGGAARDGRGGRDSGIRTDGRTGVVKDPRVLLVGYGSSASTLGATRAGAEAARRAADLIAETAGGEIVETACLVGSAPRAARDIEISRKFIEDSIGFEAPSEEIERVFRSLGFGVESAGDGKWQVNVPTCRSDVDRPDDLVE